jgi:hypothetical protein
MWFFGLRQIEMVSSLNLAGVKRITGSIILDSNNLNCDVSKAEESWSVIVVGAVYVGIKRTPATVTDGVPTDFAPGPPQYTRADLDAENAKPNSKISAGSHGCLALLGWKGTNVCTDKSMEHYDWAQNCPVNCAAATAIQRSSDLSAATDSTATVKDRGNMYTQADLDKENGLSRADHDALGGAAGGPTDINRWSCEGLLAWKTGKVCWDVNVDHHDWAQHCPANCAKANGEVIWGLHSSGSCEQMQDGCTTTDDAVVGPVKVSVFGQQLWNERDPDATREVHGTVRATVINGTLITLLPTMEGDGEHPEQHPCMANIQACSLTPLRGTDAWGSPTDHFAISQGTIMKHCPCTCEQALYNRSTGVLNAALKSAAFDGLVSVGGNIHVTDNNALVSVTFNDLAAVGGYFRVSSNAALTSAAFNALASVGNSCADELVYCGSLVGGYFVIQNNAALTSAAFSALVTVDGFFNVQSNAALASAAFGALKTVGGNFQVFLNEVLVSTTPPLGGYPTAGLAFDSLATVGGNLVVQNNTALPTAAFGALASVGGYFSILLNGALDSVAFRALATVGGNFAVAGNSALTQAAFDALASIEGHCGVYSNPQLSEALFPSLVAMEDGGGGPPSAASPQPFPPAEPGWSLTEPLAAGWQAMEPHDGAQPRRLGGNAELFVFGSRMVPAQSGNASRQLDNASAADQQAVDAEGHPYTWRKVSVPAPGSAGAAATPAKANTALTLAPGMFAAARVLLVAWALATIV